MDYPTLAQLSVRPASPTPTAARCELWSWSKEGHHAQCFRLATRESLIPGALRMRTCEECHKKREEFK